MTRRFMESATIDNRTGNIEYTAVEDVSDALNANLESQADPNNGFTTERTMRKIADIPVCVYQPWAKRIGYYQMDGNQKKMAMWAFLSEHPEYRAVDKLKHNTINQGNIFIR